MNALYFALLYIIGCLTLNHGAIPALFFVTSPTIFSCFSPHRETYMLFVLSWGACSFLACLSQLTIDLASLTKRSSGGVKGEDGVSFPIK